jgi:hypothetical protein
MLGPGRYLLGVVELAALVGFAWLGASRLRSRLLPRFEGAPAHLATGALALAVLIWAAEALGTISLFKPAPYVLLVLAIGLGLRLCVSPGGGEGEGPRTDTPARPQDSAPALPQIDSCVDLFPTAEFQEREAFDFFGIEFRGHPDLTRILLPDDYVGWPQRRDFPVGGEPVTFTYNERNYG